MSRLGRPTRLRARVARLLVVFTIAAFPMLVTGPAANAFGWDCTDVPDPEYPNAAFPTTFDSSAKDAPQGGLLSMFGGGTGYEKYGWAGLEWHTYDLGCGPDITRAPKAVADTALGNTFLTIGKSVAAAAFWLDDQTKTGDQAAAAGVTPALAQFDRIVTSVVSSMGGVYGLFLGIALTVVSAIVLWKALKADSAGVTTASAFAMGALTLGALMVGAPQKAIEVSDATLGSLITDTQGEIFNIAFDDGQGGTGQLGPGAFGSGPTDPRNILMDKIFMPDWREGWFGKNYDDSVNQLGPQLRDALAFSYDEQREILNGAPPECSGITCAPNSTLGYTMLYDRETQLTTEKAEKFRTLVSDLGDKYKLSYRQFQGKDSGRVGIGAMAMFKLSMPSLLWIGASILKLTAMLMIRFAILFAPVWVPLAIMHPRTLMRVCRTLATAYAWGVFGAVIIALYLMALVQLYNDPEVDGAWRFWFMILLTIICWCVLRPFKRMTQTITQNNSSLISRKTRAGQKALKAATFGAAGAAASGFKKMGKDMWDSRHDLARRDDWVSADGTTGTAAERPEGKALDYRRRAEATDAVASARRQRGSGRLERLNQSRLARLDGQPDRKDPSGTEDRFSGAADKIAASREKMDISGTAWRTEWREAAAAIENVNDAPRGVGDRWDGGASSAIAPMRVFTPARPDHPSDLPHPMDRHLPPRVPRRAAVGDKPLRNIRLYQASRFTDAPSDDAPADRDW